MGNQVLPVELVHASAVHQTRCVMALDTANDFHFRLQVNAGIEGIGMVAITAGRAVIGEVLAVLEFHPPGIDSRVHTRRLDRSARGAFEVDDPRGWILCRSGYRDP
jgi:hypothetical protein